MAAKTPKKPRAPRKPRAPAAPAAPAARSSAVARTRVTVLVGQIKAKGGSTATTTNAYSFMNKATADYFGFKIEAKPTTKPSTGAGGNNQSATRLVRGSIGAGSVKVKGADKKTYSIPIPVGITASQTKEFLLTATKNKPDTFVTKNGRSFPIVSATK